MASASTTELTQLEKVEAEVKKLAEKIEVVEAKGDKRTVRDDKDLDAWRKKEEQLRDEKLLLLGKGLAPDSGKS